MRYAEIAVDAPAGHSRTFSYSIPDDLTLVPGQIVRVPFGSQRLQGVVMSLEPEPKVPQTRDVAALVEETPVLDATRLELAKWVSHYYMSTLFEAAAPMLPPGLRSRPKVTVTLNADVAAGIEDTLSESQQKLVAYLRKNGAVDQSRLARALGDWAMRAAQSLAKRGVVTLTGVHHRPAIAAKYVRYVTLAIPPDEARLHLDSFGRAVRQKALLEHLSGSKPPLLVAEARKEYGAPALKALLERGWIVEREQREYRDPLAGKEYERSGPVELTPAQKDAVTQIVTALENPDIQPKMFLLQGVTGSGKTEVYLEAIARCLAQGKRVIFLVPEIALTHQTIERLEGRFPGEVAVQHSGLKPGERFDQWWEIKDGAYGIVVGSRGAIFAPQSDLGLIVVDEEHEWTYK
ncbi:MAG: DEAD/DEAH box helicase, partial [SAR202 cluster bacterium]|nr:DEAD/DEAH box helicase [SAR202 cluster bacterium]